jgi:hemerythrin
MKRNIIAEKKNNGIKPLLIDHNVYIKWSTDYDLGIPIIDDQHRGIVIIINSLHFGMQNVYVKNMLAPIIDMMNHYTRIHFQVEEDFLDLIGVADVERHRELHRELSSKLADAGRKSMFDKDPHQFMDFLKEWWLGHICDEDLKYKDNFRSFAESLAK